MSNNFPLPPDKVTIRATRRMHRLKQREAAALIYCGTRAWMEWEAGNREMHPGLWELFLSKAGKSGKSSPEKPIP